MKDQQKKERSGQRPVTVQQEPVLEHRPSGWPITRLLDWRYAYLLIVLPCLVYSLVYTAKAIPRDFTPIPIWDNWRTAAVLDQLFRHDFTPLLSQHNEHRIVFPELVFVLDYFYFRGMGLLPIAANILCQLLHMLIMWWVLKREEEIPFPFRLSLAAAIGLFMGSALQVSALGNPFLLQWYMCHFAATLSLLLLWSATRSRAPMLPFVGCLAAATVATYSSGNGMLLWPLLVLIAAVCRLAVRRVVTVGVTGLGAIAAYFVHYAWMNSGGVSRLLSHPLYAISFVSVYLGSPVSYVSSRLGGMIGLAGMGLVIAAIVVSVRQNRARSPLFFIAIGNCLFMIGTAVLTAMARMDPADPSVGAATAARYVSIPLTYWSYLAIVMGWLAARWARKHELGLHVTLCVLLLVLVGVIMPRQKSYEQIFAGQQARQHESGLALLVGVDDPEVLRVLYPDDQWVLRAAPALRQRRLSIFAAGRDLTLGQPVNGIFTIAPPEFCAGALLSISSVKGGARAIGWAFDRRENRAPRDIVLTTASGTIVGLGETRYSGYPSSVAGLKTGPPGWRWVAFLRTGERSEPIQAYAVVENGQMACPLGPPREPSNAKAVAGQNAGPLIPIAEWQADPAWTLNGFHPSAGTLASGVAYGSWSGNDQGQGRLRSAPFPTERSNCIVVPVAHGPSVIGQSVLLSDPDSGKILETIPLGDRDGNWTYWSVQLKQPGVSRLQILAEDKGSQWGQWVAVGQPHCCKQ